MCPYHLKIFKTLKYSNKLDINLKVEITWNWFKYCKKKKELSFALKTKKQNKFGQYLSHTWLTGSGSTGQTMVRVKN